MVERIVWISHEAQEMSEGDNIQWCVYPCVCARVCSNACMQMCLCASVSLSTDKHSPAAPTTATPPDTENKVMENYSHKTAQCIISQTPEPEGAWLWRFIIAYWIIWINLTHLGLCVFPSSQLSRLFVSDNYTKWVISVWAPFLFSLPT